MFIYEWYIYYLQSIHLLLRTHSSSNHLLFKFSLPLRHSLHTTYKTYLYRQYVYTNWQLCYNEYRKVLYTVWHTSTAICSTVLWCVHIAYCTVSCTIHFIISQLHFHTCTYITHQYASSSIVTQTSGRKKTSLTAWFVAVAAL